MRSLVFITLFLSLFGCAPRAITGSSVNGASVVALVHPELGLDEHGIEPTAPRYVPYCNAFAMLDGDRVRLVTAEHCTDGATSIRYLAPNGIGHGHATLERRDAARDLAWFEPADAEGLAPLVSGPPPRVGSRVSSVSKLFDATLRGTVTERYFGGFYETNQTIQRGWSGSPVLDDTGRVWGVVSGCPWRQASALEGDFECVFGAIVAALEVE
jgi:hypothetical protein